MNLHFCQGLRTAGAILAPGDSAEGVRLRKAFVKAGERHGIHWQWLLYPASLQDPSDPPESGLCPGFP